MSRLLSLKLKDDVLNETEKVLKRTGKVRNAYFNEAIHLYNQLWQRKLLRKRLRADSALVAGDSLGVLEILEQFEDEIS